MVGKERHQKDIVNEATVSVRKPNATASIAVKRPNGRLKTEPPNNLYIKLCQESVAILFA